MKMKSPGKLYQKFEGVAYYKSDNTHHHSATWFDSGGDMHPIKATDDSKTLIYIW